MPSTTEYTFTRYLASKKTVDDRALNRRVWRVLADHLAHEPAPMPLRLLEIGSGIGTMVERVLEWDLFPGDIAYTALDSSPENTAEAHRRLPAWGSAQGIDVGQSGDTLILSKAPGQITVDLQTADAFEFASRKARRRQWDLLIANAFLDLVNIPAALPQLFALLEPGALFYFTITFDGVTGFAPIIDQALDAQIEDLYHADMDARRLDGQPTGGSRAGRGLLQHTLASGAQVLAAGASDWIVYPGQHGYPHDEAYFLHFIIHTIEQALAGHPQLDARAFEDWVARRHRQIEAGELIYVAHQFDLLGQRPA